MGKRGQLVYKGLIIIIASALIFYAFVNAGKSYGSKDAYYKLAVARDIAMAINSLYSLPGDVNIEYGKDLTKYTIVLNGNNVKVYRTDLGKLDVTSGQYKFAGPEITNVRIESPKQLLITKSGEKILILDKLVFSQGEGNFGGAGAQGNPWESK